ncbi:MAG: HAMP domain-containing sensor histidine kinase [Eubacteriales bacterium]|nr:HAMP domain-containing sensor histidine kinase [Eubacteriales bacterium]
MNKLKSVLKGLAVILGAMLLFYAVFHLVDVVFDRRVGDWFERSFLLFIYYNDRIHGAYRELLFRWDTFKNFLLIASLGAVALWTGSLVLTAHLCRARAERKSNARERETKAAMDLKEQQIQQEIAQKNDLIAYLAHDMKTPLTSVIGYLSLLEEAQDMPADQRKKYTRITLDKAMRLEGLINEFFEITRYNLHQVVLEKRPLDLSYLLTQLVDEFYPILKTKNNTVYLDAGERLMIQADPMKLARVFNNLLKNAVTYSDPDTPISITAQLREGRVRIAFSNQCATIPKEKLATIFEKFYRLDDARGSQSGGAGLGLAIAREIVTAHNGTITAESENGKTTFTVELPTQSA